MEKWLCTVCGYTYDPEVGDPDNGIPAGTPFHSLPDDWRCPRCTARKAKFIVKEESPVKTGILKRLYQVEDAAYYLIAVTLFINAAILIYISISHLMQGLTTMNILYVVNDLLLVVIILELFSTVLIYLTERRISLTPFLLIGVISSVRRILMISAQMSVHAVISTEEFNRAITELLVSTGIIIVLIISYYLLSKIGRSVERCVGCLGITHRNDSPGQ